MRRFVGFPLVLALFGCANNTPQPEAAPAAAGPTPLPDAVVGDISRATPIRGGKGEAPPEPPPKPPEPGTITLPADGGAWPWNLSPAPTPETTAAAPFDFPKGRITGVAVAPAAKRAVVTIGEAPVGKNAAWTRVVLCDLAAGTVATEWEVREKYEVIDLSQDGTRMLLMRSGSGPREMLYLWTIEPDFTLKRRSWQPHDLVQTEVFGALSTISTPTDREALEGRHVRWAAFAGDRIVTASAEGQLRVWDAGSLERLGSIDAAPGKPALSPDGTRVAFLTPRGVALLDPTAAKVVGTRPFGFPPGERTLAFSPDGKTLACAAPQRIAFLDLATGEKWDAVGQRLSAHPDGAPRSFGWLGDSHLMAEERVFDTELPIPVWQYGGWSKCAFRGRELWVVTSKENGKSAVAGFTLPQPGLAEALASRKTTPGMFTLRAGDSVRIDVSGLPADKQDAARASLDRRLRQIGYVPNASATAVLYATEDRTGVPRVETYFGGRKMRYDARFARLKLVAGGKTLWEGADTVGAPLTVQLGGKRTMADIADEYGVGRPDYRLFDRARIPTMFPGPNFPSLGFGGSRLTADGLKGDLLPRR